MARTRLCTNAQVLQTANFNSEDEVGGSDVVDEAVEEAEAEVFGDWGEPIKKSNFVLDSTQTKYEFRTDKSQTYRLDQVIIRDDNNDRRVYTEADSGDDPSETSQTYTKDFQYNTITFASATVNAWNGNRVEIDYVPIQFHHLARLKAALNLIDGASLTNAETDVPVIIKRLTRRIDALERTMTNHLAIGSSNEFNYDPTLGETIPQRRFWTYS